MATGSGSTFGPVAYVSDARHVIWQRYLNSTTHVIWQQNNDNDIQTVQHTSIWKQNNS